MSAIKTNGRASFLIVKHFLLFSPWKKVKSMKETRVLSSVIQKQRRYFKQ